MRTKDEYETLNTPGGNCASNRYPLLPFQMGSSAIGTMRTVVAGVTLLAFVTVAHAALGKYIRTFYPLEYNERDAVEPPVNM